MKYLFTVQPAGAAKYLSFDDIWDVKAPVTVLAYKPGDIIVIFIFLFSVLSLSTKRWPLKLVYYITAFWKSSRFFKLAKNGFWSNFKSNGGAHVPKRRRNIDTIKCGIKISCAARGVQLKISTPIVPLITEKRFKLTTLRLKKRKRFSRKRDQGKSTVHFWKHLLKKN